MIYISALYFVRMIKKRWKGDYAKTEDNERNGGECRF